MTAAAWFASLAPRERVLILLAGALALLAVLILGLIQPLDRHHQSLDAQLADKRALLADLERVAARFGTGMTGPTPPGSGESLVVLVDRTSRSRGVAQHLRRNEPDGADGIRLRFENVPFDDLVLWLGDIQAMHGVAVTTASADPAEATGRVNASVQLQRSSRP